MNSLKNLQINIVMLALTLLFVIILIFPLCSLLVKAFLSSSGSFVGLENYMKYFATPALSASIGNTIYISTVSAVFGTLFGFLYAYGLARTNIMGKKIFYSINTTIFTNSSTWIRFGVFVW